MNRTESEWIAAWAIVFKKLRPWRRVVEECPINVGREVLMKICRKCRREYYADCIPCSFRNGGNIAEEERDEKDTLHGMAAMTRYWNLYNTLAWMRIGK